MAVAMKTLTKLPLRKVISSHLTWTGNPHFAGNYPGNRHFLDEELECGHKVESPVRPAKRRRCFDCRSQREPRV